MNISSRVMLAHPLVKYSTFLPGVGDARRGGARNRWLQCRPMRIELPPASWADAAHRADDDAHTLTLVAQAAEDWILAPADPAVTLRTGTSDAPVPVTLTLTLPL